jgi:thiamine-phosphate pyrophosphorylase
VEPPRRRERLAAARLVFVVDARVSLSLVAGALAGGVDVLQLRDQEATPLHARALARLADGHDALFVVSGRTDLAADGIHFEDEPAPLPDELVLGLSVETAAEAEEARADYLFVGPVWATPTKPGHPGIGLATVREASRTARVPVFAVGGVDASNAAEAAAAGADGVAVIRAIADAADPAAAARALRQSVTSAAGPTMPT